jgi:para-nitrobenzyl esterase
LVGFVVTADNGLVVETTNGQVQGFFNGEFFPTARKFLGIPFAQPPIGNLRFG